MQRSNQASRAYESASRNRSQRDQEADVFRHATAVLKSARQATGIQRVRALADNRRLWLTVNDLMRDPANALPEATRAGIVSISMSVQREMEQDAPDFGFLISINENFIAGLSGQP
ncbi:flagellar biosynthesis regulator FlaF [Rhodopila sp.]|uniref:flagellar biosynthesis regulator FlaF n=1 Tax=Rhodopila sp. TaxID=2480087 RepID=UPI003D0EA6B4